MKEKRELTKEEKTNAYRTVARLGGIAVLKKRGKRHMSELGKKGAASRWKKNNQ